MDRQISVPIKKEDAVSLRAGDYVTLTGTIYTARDAAHKRMQETLDAGEALPIEMQGNVIYYMGPSPAREGRPIGSAGPTTASRMDKYAPKLLDLGLGAMIGKGKRSQAVVDAIVRNGLEPVFCDVNPVDFTMDVTKIEELITDRTSAIMPVYVYGNICNVDEIQRIADKYGLKVIYDAAHTFGVRYKDRGIASFGDVSCFSFHATKVFNSIEGGAACFKDKDFGLELYRLKNFGIRGPEVVDGVGANAKMNEFCAAMGLCR